MSSSASISPTEDGQGRPKPPLGMGVSGQAGQRMTVTAAGRLDVNQTAFFLDRLQKEMERRTPSAVTLALEGLDYLDTAGALALVLAQEQGKRLGLAVTLEGLNERGRQMLGMVKPEELARPPIKAAPGGGGLVEGLGASAREMGRDLMSMVGFMGEFTRAALHVAAHPRRLRVGDVLASMVAVGVEGLPIVALISFLLGTIMAFMSSLQLKSFGADIYVATLVALAMVRELGPIMTAILVAGRSGSSFAAEIGTMRVNEEVDALVVMGFQPTVFLALPKVIAAVLTVPLLTVFSDVAAILGGMFVGVTGLDLTPYAYFKQTMRSLGPWDVIIGMGKAAAFALLIAGIGCQRGFEVGGGAAGVGRATTSAVVASLFMIIVADSFFAILQYYVF